MQRQMAVECGKKLGIKLDFGTDGRGIMLVVVNYLFCLALHYFYSGQIGFSAAQPLTAHDTSDFGRPKILLIMPESTKLEYFSNPFL